MPAAETLTRLPGSPFSKLWLAIGASGDLGLGLVQVVMVHEAGVDLALGDGFGDRRVAVVGLDVVGLQAPSQASVASSPSVRRIAVTKAWNDALPARSRRGRSSRLGQRRPDRRKLALPSTASVL